MIRITGGEHRGRILKTREGGGTRPTPAIVREALFDIISTRIKDAGFMDLYAGTGAVGIEALSRGARFSLFVENDRGAASVIRSNLRAISAENRSDVVVLPVVKAVRTASFREILFDFVFIDPPYSEDPWEELLGLLSESPVITGKTRLFLQHYKKKTPSITASFRLVKEYSYGDTKLTVVERDLS